MANCGENIIDCLNCKYPDCIASGPFTERSHNKKDERTQEQKEIDRKLKKNKFMLIGVKMAYVLIVAKLLCVVLFIVNHAGIRTECDIKLNMNKIKARIKSKNNKCFVCGCVKESCLDLYDILIGENLFSICDLCNEKLQETSLHLLCYTNHRIKTQQDLKIKRERNKRK